MPPAQPIRPPKEQHFIFCALCLTGEIFTSSVAAERWQSSHMRHTHNKYNAHAPNAQRSIMILYETKDDTVAQDPSHTDPTGAFLQMTMWMSDRGHI